MKNHPSIFPCLREIYQFALKIGAAPDISSSSATAEQVERQLALVCKLPTSAQAVLQAF
jgi:hypothetical protein